MYQWSVVGAGPAGIAAVGKLIDEGVPAKEIVWIDPAFRVGDFGTIWRHVPSNTKVKLFTKFLLACQSFGYAEANKKFALQAADPEKTCELGLMADALQWVSDHLVNKVHAVKDTAHLLTMKNRAWEIKLEHSTVRAKNVVLAIGAEPKQLTYPAVSVIPLQDAMDHERIKKHYDQNDTIALFGSSHSAILALRNLVENKVKRIINFYRAPLRYAVYLDNWILFDDTGLKGTTADWAREHVDGNWPKNLERIYSSEENIEQYLPECTKAIYAVGFERRLLPVVDSIGPMSYIEQCGIIAPGLFGLGIAYPEAKINPFGLLEYRVGLWKFMDYLERVLPVWMKYQA